MMRRITRRMNFYERMKRQPFPSNSRVCINACTPPNDLYDGELKFFS